MAALEKKFEGFEKSQSKFVVNYFLCLYVIQQLVIITCVDSDNNSSEQ